MTMSVSGTKLYRRIKKNLMENMPVEELTTTRIRRKLEKNSLTPLLKYQLSSFLWCKSCALTFTRLKRIREMLNRSLYPRKGESKSKRIQNWMAYNYQIYSVVFQSILEVTILLTNEVLDLGYSKRQCSYESLRENRRVKASGINPVLRQLYDDTFKHRVSKNELVHQGKSISIPHEYKATKKIEIDFSTLTQDISADETEIREFFEGFIAANRKSKFIADLENECNSIESKVEKLFDKLLPQYIKIQAFYK
jgi:hypothetical protein